MDYYRKIRLRMILDQETAFCGSRCCKDCRHWNEAKVFRRGLAYGECRNANDAIDIREYPDPPLFPQDTRCNCGTYRPTIDAIKDDPYYELIMDNLRQWAQERRAKRRQLAKIYY